MILPRTRAAQPVPAPLGQVCIGGTTSDTGTYKVTLKVVVLAVRPR